MASGLKALVSVIVPVYNAASYLDEAIESVLAQTYAPSELIVLDDGSTDGSGDVAARYGPVVKLVRGERVGLGGARNKALGFAEGDYLAFLDADDRFRPKKLELQMEILDGRPELDMVFGHMTEFISPELDRAAVELLREPVQNVPWRTPNLMLVRRKAFDRVGPFSTTLRVGIGVDWYARAVEAGLKEAVPPVTVLERRLHASNNGIRERDARNQYLHVLRNSIARRRAAAEEALQAEEQPTGGGDGRWR